MEGKSSVATKVEDFRSSTLVGVASVVPSEVNAGDDNVKQGTDECTTNHESSLSSTLKINPAPREKPILTSPKTDKENMKEHSASKCLGQHVTSKVMMEGTGGEGNNASNMETGNLNLSNANEGVVKLDDQDVAKLSGSTPKELHTKSTYTHSSTSSTGAQEITNLQIPERISRRDEQPTSCNSCTSWREDTKPRKRSSRCLDQRLEKCYWKCIFLCEEVKSLKEPGKAQDSSKCSPAILKQAPPTNEGVSKREAPIWSVQSLYNVEKGKIVITLAVSNIVDNGTPPQTKLVKYNRKTEEFICYSSKIIDHGIPANDCLKQLTEAIPDTL